MEYAMMTIVLCVLVIGTLVGGWIYVVYNYLK